jgi:hypothetical protein
VGAAHRAAQTGAQILLIITDDAGFGVPSTFGGVIPTPTMDRIAKTVCATTTSTPPRCARRRGPR